jgi:putative ABC transport system permease protein
VRGVSAADGAPFFGGANMVWKARRADASPDIAPIEVHSNSIYSSTYFTTLAIPIVEGRGFSDAEIAAGRRGVSRVVVLSQNLARHLFGTVSPIGRAIDFAGQRRGEPYEVIGVAGTARYSNLVTPPEEMFYEPAGSRSISSGAVVIVRTNGSVPLAARAAAIAAELNPALPLTAVMPISQAVAGARSAWDSLALIIGVLTAVATLLACVGLYGVVAHGVAERRRELGIRIALGATRAQVWTLVLRRASVITTAGILLGLAGGAAFSRVIGARLVGVSPYDPVVWTLAAVSLAAVAGVASLGPARSAVRVDVNETLRAL